MQEADVDGCVCMCAWRISYASFQLPAAVVVTLQDNAWTQNPSEFPSCSFTAMLHWPYVALLVGFDFEDSYWPQFPNTSLHLPLHSASSCPREIYHILNLVIGWQSRPLPEWWQGGIDKKHNAVSFCFSLFIYSSQRISQARHIFLSLSVSKETAIQTQRDSKMNTPLICLYYCPFVQLFIFFPYLTFWE